jgi:hypothetical protein
MLYLKKKKLCVHLTQLKRYSVFVIPPTTAFLLWVIIWNLDACTSIYIYLSVLLVSHTFSTIHYINLSNTERSLPAHSLAVSVLKHDHNEPISYTEKLCKSIPVTKSLLYKNYIADHRCLIGTTTLLLRCIPFRNSPSRSYLPLKKYILTYLW